MRAWNRDRAVGQKTPFTPKQVRLLKEILGNKKTLRDLALFSLGIDTMLRAGDLVNLTVSDISDSNGKILNEFPVRQQKTKEPHIVLVSEGTQEILNKWIKQSQKYSDDYLFTGRDDPSTPLTTRRYRQLVKEWAKYLHLDSNQFSTHSLRRTKASLVYKKTGNLEAVRQLLGQKTITSTSFYLNVSKREALDLAKAVDL